MKLRQITILGSAVITFSLMAAMIVISREILLRNYAKLEQEHIRSDLRRAVRLLNSELDHLDRTTQDYASWDDTYEYMVAPNLKYIRANYSDLVLQNLKVRAVMLVDRHGRIVFQRSMLTAGQRRETPADTSQLLLASRLLRDTSRKGGLTGTVMLSEGPVIMAVRPILTSEEMGQARGVLVMAVNLDFRFAANLSSLSELPLSFARIDNRVSRGLEQTPQELAVAQGFASKVLAPDCIAGYLPIMDMWGHPALVLEAKHDRELWVQGKHSIEVLMISIVLLGGTFGGLKLWILHHYVISRVEKLITFTRSVEANGLKSRIQIDGCDEIAQLAGHMNHMVEEIEASQQKLVAIRERLQFEATHDALTGAWNRAAALDLLDRELARGEREGTSVAVIMFDADHFKNINDQHGHATGDRVLQLMTASIGRILRTSDVLARYGGEEFLVIAPNCEVGPARQLAERILLRLRSTPMEVSEQSLIVTASAGVTAGAFPQTAENLIAVADRALYCAKGLGRDRVESEELLDVKANLYAMARRLS
jgi:diguanylate cyclase (GGDEF)-like protein